MAGRNGRRWLRVPVGTWQADVVVAGGGSTGVAAAVAAAKQGAKTLLIERYGFLGGTATGAAVQNFQVGPNVRGAPVIRGHFAEVVRELEQLGAIRGQLFDPEVLKFVHLQMCEAAGVELLLHALLTDARVEDGRLTKLAVETKAGLEEVEGTVFVDGTADGDLAYKAGAPYELGRPGDGRMQAMTLQFQLSNIDFPKLRAADLKALWRLFEQECPHVVTSRGKISFSYMAAEGKINFNMTHVGGLSGVDSRELTRAEVIARQQAFAVWQFFRRHVPGCERCIVAATGVQVGVRETRRILGDYVVTRQDLLRGAKFADAVGRSTSWIDIHHPIGTGVLHEYLPRDDWYEIPYRALITRELRNLYTAGRCMSSTHEALGSTREIPTCMVTGQAAGAAAALCVKHGVEPRGLDVTTLRQALLDQGVDLGPEHTAAVLKTRGSRGAGEQERVGDRAARFVAVEHDDGGERASEVHSGVQVEASR